MADVTLVPQRINDVGVTPTRTGSLSTSNTYIVRNTGRMWLHFKKSGAGACVVTIQTPKTVGGLAVAERTLTVPATTGDKTIGPFPPGTYNDALGDLRFTLSDIAGLDVAVLQI